MHNYKLIQTSPASTWLRSSFVGCGRMGASLIGGVGCETVYLNEETVWSENTDIKLNPDMPEKIASVRALFLDGKPAEANKLARSCFGDCFNRIRPFETAGMVKISMHQNDHCRAYRSVLDLMSGIYTLEYDKDGSHYTRQCFASYPDDVIAIRISSSNKPIDAHIYYDRLRTISCNSADDTITATAKTIFGEHRFACKIRAVTDGDVVCENGELHICNTKSFCLYISIETEFKQGADYVSKISLPQSLDFDALMARHIADFSSLMQASDITLPSIGLAGELTKNELNELRGHDQVREQAEMALLWQFGRYMLVSSSRKGHLPANLQGVWCGKSTPEWNCDYHTNINIQAHYWAAEAVGLSECHLPLFDYMNDYLLESGKNTAKVCYNSRGCVVHHLSDIYKYTGPADGLWGLWPHGASWLSLHMWEHYLYTGDLDFLRDEAYEFIKEASVFFIDNLVEGKDGRLYYGPSTSPENHYYAPDENGNDYHCYLTHTSTMDIEIITTLFNIYIGASDVLGINNADVESAKKAIAKLPPLRVGKFGQLMEWIEDYTEVEPGHRHTSHSFGVFPSNLINRSTPELMDALNVTIDRRLSGMNYNGGASEVGWSMAWLGSAAARLRRADLAYRLASSFAFDHVNKGYLDVLNVAGKDVFQSDGNLGYVATVTEMLLQSHEGVIALIPSITKEWEYGSFRGLRARGGFEISASWDNMQITEIKIKSSFTDICKIELPKTQTNHIFIDELGKEYQAVDSIITLDFGNLDNKEIVLKIIRDR